MKNNFTIHCLLAIMVCYTPTVCAQPSFNSLKGVMPAILFLLNDEAPIAFAGNDIQSTVGNQIELDGSGSVSQHSGNLHFNWSILSKPSSSSSTILNPDTAYPSIVLDSVGEYKIQLVVSNSIAVSKPDTITIRALPKSDNGVDNFDGFNPILTTINNPLDADSNGDGLPDVMRVTKTTGRYIAEIIDNSSNQTLHFNQDQGRLDATIVSFPFEFIARNIGIGVDIDNSQTPPEFNVNDFNFAGVQVHSLDLNSRNSSHVVVGHRSPTPFTIEGKNTVNGQSTVNDIGANKVSLGRADLRIVGNSDRTLTIFWQPPNLNHLTQPDDWQLYGPSWNLNPDGSLPGNNPSFGSQVYVGLITYAYFSSGVPFIGVCDSVQIIQN